MSRFSTQSQIRAGALGVAPRPLQVGGQIFRADISNQQEVIGISEGGVRLLSTIAKIRADVNARESAREQISAVNQASAEVRNKVTELSNSPGSPAEVMSEWNAFTEEFQGRHDPIVVNKTLSSVASGTRLLTNEARRRSDSLWRRDFEYQIANIDEDTDIPALRQSVLDAPIVSEELRTSLLERLDKRSEGLRFTADLLRPGSDTSVLQSKDKNNDFYSDLRETRGFTIAGVASVYANPRFHDVPLPSDMVGDMKAARPRERNDALLAIKLRDPLAAKSLAHEFGKSAWALYNATSHLDLIRDRDEINARTEVAEDEASYANAILDAEKKLKGQFRRAQQGPSGGLRGFVGGQDEIEMQPLIVPMTLDERASRMGIDGAQLSGELIEKYDAMYLHAYATLVKDPKAPNDRGELISVAMSRAGSMMNSDGVIPPIISNRPLSSSFAVRDAAGVEKLKVEVQSVLEGKISRQGDTVDLRPFEEIAPGDVAPLMPRDIGGFIEPTDVLVDEPFISGGKQMFPIKKGAPTVGFFEWNPDGPSRVHRAGSKHYERIVRSKGAERPRADLLTDDFFKWKPAYHNRYFDEVSPEKVQPLHDEAARLFRLEMQRPFDRTRDGDMERYSRYVARILRTDQPDGWLGLSRSKTTPSE